MPNLLADVSIVNRKQNEEEIKMLFDYYEENDVVESKDLTIDWNARTNHLAQLNEERRREACEIIGSEEVYRFNFQASLVTDREYGFSKSIDILADSVADAEQTARDYFLAGNIEMITYYKHIAEKENGSCSFKMNRLLTKEQSVRLNEEFNALDEALEETELAMTL